MCQVIFSMQQHPTHQPIMTQIPSAFDDIALGESMRDVLTRGPVEGETRIKDERVQPMQAKQPMKRDEENDDSHSFKSHAPDQNVANVRKKITCQVRLAQDAFPQRTRRKGNDHGAKRNKRPEQSYQNSIPLDVFHHDVVVRVIQIEHLRVGAVVLVVISVRAANQRERNREKHPRQKSKPIISPPRRLQIPVRGFVQERVVGQQQVGIQNPNAEQFIPMSRLRREPEQSDCRAEDCNHQNAVQPIGNRHVGRCGMSRLRCFAAN